MIRDEYVVNFKPPASEHLTQPVICAKQPIRNRFQRQSLIGRLNRRIRSSQIVDFRNACSALHTLEWTMSELLELKLSTVPEMDPKQT